MGLNNLKGIGPSTNARIFRWGLLVVFAACFLPIPSLPDLSRESDGEQYPCQGSLCGCRTAYQCWTSCCCTTPDERLAWAVENKVAPPVYAVLSSSQFTPSRDTSRANKLLTHDVNDESVSSRDSDVGTNPSEEASCPHCSNKTKQITLIESETYCGTLRAKSLTDSNALASTANEPEIARDATNDGKDSRTDTSKPKRKPPKVRFVRVLDALKCHGLAFTIDLINQCVIPELHAVTISVDLGETLLDAVRVPYPVYLAVSIPPPRLS
jgi:hypothetical protein